MGLSHALRQSQRWRPSPLPPHKGGGDPMSKRVAQVIVETLQSAGVKNCYGIVGDTLNTFATSLNRSDIKFVHMRHQEAGAYAAQPEALLMHRLTAMAGTFGPAIRHFL